MLPPLSSHLRRPQSPAVSSLSTNRPLFFLTLLPGPPGWWEFYVWVYPGEECRGWVIQVWLRKLKAGPRKCRSPARSHGRLFCPERFSLTLCLDTSRAATCIAGALLLLLPLFVLLMVPACAKGASLRRSPSPSFPSLSHPGPCPTSFGHHCSSENRRSDQTRPDQTRLLSSRSHLWARVPCCFVSLAPGGQCPGGQIAPEGELLGLTQGPKAMMRKKVRVETTLPLKMHWEVKTPS